MSYLLPNLEHFFQENIRIVHNASEKNDPNRVESLVVCLRDYERTLCVILSRLGESGAPDDQMN